MSNKLSVLFAKTDKKKAKAGVGDSVTRRDAFSGESSFSQSSVSIHLDEPSDIQVIEKEAVHSPIEHASPSDSEPLDDVISALQVDSGPKLFRARGGQTSEARMDAINWPALGYTESRANKPKNIRKNEGNQMRNASGTDAELVLSRTLQEELRYDSPVGVQEGKTHITAPVVSPSGSAKGKYVPPSQRQSGNNTGAIESASCDKNEYAKKRASLSAEHGTKHQENVSALPLNLKLASNDSTSGSGRPKYISPSQRQVTQHL